MGKWIAQLTEKAPAPPYTPTAKTDKRGVLSVLSVPPQGGAGSFSAAATADALAEAQAAEAAREAFEERAAIMEYDGGLSRADAERAAADLERDADLACWPHSRAMNGAEIAAFLVRERRFVAVGLTPREAEALADKLVTRDRDGGDWHACAECAHLSDGDRRAGRWYCREYRAAGLGTPALAAELVTQPHRCAGFAAADTAATPHTL